jgi:4-carboxymuconolactone decarboxylase
VKQRRQEISMRLPLIPPETLKGEQRALYDDMKKGIEKSFRGFKAIDDGGALIGPWNPWLTFPQFGGPVWNFTKAMASDPKLPKGVREVAILVTGTHFHSGYELYAHILVGEARGLSDETIATIVSGEKPTSLTKEEALAYNFASALVSGRIAPKLLYDQAQNTFGRDGVAELIYFVALYCAVSVVLNGFDVPVPE